MCRAPPLETSNDSFRRARVLAEVERRIDHHEDARPRRLGIARAAHDERMPQLVKEDEQRERDPELVDEADGGVQDLRRIPDDDVRERRLASSGSAPDLKLFEAAKTELEEVIADFRTSNPPDTSITSGPANPSSTSTNALPRQRGRSDGWTFNHRRSFRSFSGIRTP